MLNSFTPFVINGAAPSLFQADITRIPPVSEYEAFCETQRTGSRNASVWDDPKRVRRMVLALRGSTPGEVAKAFRVSTNTLNNITKALPKELL